MAEKKSAGQPTKQQDAPAPDKTEAQRIEEILSRPKPEKCGTYQRDPKTGEVKK